MLGSAIVDEFSKPDYELILTSRTELKIRNQTNASSVSQAIQFSAETDNLMHSLPDSWSPDYIINCIGLTKSHIKMEARDHISAAIRVNALFPNDLAQVGEITGAKIIQIATDCVFSGRTGGYTEESPHDAEDVYGKTKSLGEVASSNVMHLRSSTIGPEAGRSTLLLEWVRNQPANASINGFSDHIWNGVTTKAFARVSRGIVDSGNFRPGVHHLIPADKIDKDNLLRLICKTYKRTDITVNRTRSDQPIDRTLQTNNQAFNQTLWEGARYKAIPTISNLLEELSGQEA